MDDCFSRAWNPFFRLINYKQDFTNSLFANISIDLLQLRYIFRGISVYYLEAAILVYQNTLALYAVSIKTCPVSLVSIYKALLAYVAITFHPIQHILEALLVHDCVYRDRHRSYYLQKC